MKKLILLFSAVIIATAASAQDSKAVKAQTASDKKMTHECYMMKDNALWHCMGTDAKAQTTNVKLKNGTTITSTGEVKQEDGATTKLKNGQCVSLMGSIGDCGQMHAALKEEKPHGDMK